MTKNKILKTWIVIFSVFNLVCCHTIKEDGKKVQIGLDANKDISMLIDSLSGTWELINTIRYEDGDTIIQEPSSQLWLTPGAKPFTTITIDSLKNFKILQFCFKCPYLFWKGQFEIEIRTLNGIEFFYIHFVDYRMKSTHKKKSKEYFTLDFDGYLTNFENNHFTLKDKMGTDWIYKRP